ncbi:MFS transporter [Candidatus Parcubacteria bacterium]|nr:MFS transporter [Candidatus Parcubacteria bacterium]
MLTPKLNRKIAVLLYGANLWFLGEGMFGPLLAIFTQRLGGDILNITSAWATYLIVTGILTIIIGRFSDRSNKEWLLVMGYALNAIFTFGYLFIETPKQLLLLQAGLGLAAALSTPTWNALYAQHEDRKRAGFTWGLAGGEFQITTGIAIIIGGLIVSRFPFSTLFIVMGCIQVIATIYQAQILKMK